MKKVYQIIIVILFIGINNVNGQDNKQDEVIEFLNGSKRVKEKRNKKDYIIGSKIAEKIAEISEGSEIPLELLKKDNTFIVLTSNMKDKMFVYYYTTEKKLKKKFTFGSSFEKKLKKVSVK